MCTTSGYNHIHTNKHRIDIVIPAIPKSHTHTQKKTRQTETIDVDGTIFHGTLYMVEKNIFTMFDVINFRIEQHEDVFKTNAERQTSKKKRRTSSSK